MRRPIPRSQSCITLIRERSPRPGNEIALSRKLVDSAKIFLEIFLLKMPKIILEASRFTADSMLLEFSNIVKAVISKLSHRYFYYNNVKWGVKNVVENTKNNLMKIV